MNISIICKIIKTELSTNGNQNTYKRRTKTHTKGNNKKHLQRGYKNTKQWKEKEKTAGLPQRDGKAGQP